MNFITLPSGLVGFNNQTTEIVETISGREMYLLHGVLSRDEADSICPHCNRRMHIHNEYEVNLKHLCFGRRLSTLRFSKLKIFWHMGSRTRKLQNLQALERILSRT